MNVEFDVSRLDRVADVLGTSVPEIVAGILANLADAIAGLHGPLEQQDLEGVAKVTHACRNEALLIAAQPLLRTLTDLEQAARHGRLADAQVALAALRNVWPDTRRALAEIAAPDD